MGQTRGYSLAGLLGGLQIPEDCPHPHKCCAQGDGVYCGNSSRIGEALFPLGLVSRNRVNEGLEADVIESNSAKS